MITPARGARTAPVRLAVAGRLVYSPHDYPASVFPQSYFSAADYPSNLYDVWDAMFKLVYCHLLKSKIKRQFLCTL